jgi:23S rRNA (guanine2445-N2)-methyltransferase / 23S rRNA (guanine2069-N7)-methyltransferase
MATENSSKYSLFATTAKEMENLLAEELQALGASKVEKKRAGVSFEGSLETAYRICLWSRIANRILLPLKTFPAPNPEKLYGGVKSIRWSDHLSADQTIAVDFSSSQSQITHTHFGALKVKDAIVDQLRSVQGIRPSVDVHQPNLRINVYVLKDEATVSLDLSGDSLHMRGYREQGAFAPLKENLAAAILAYTEWPKQVRENPAEFSLMDPMCGSGTLPIEAAMMAANIAPGLAREYYGFIGWRQHDPEIWRRLKEEAKDQVIRDKKKLPRIVGYDQDFRAVRVAIANLERAGLRASVHIEKRELSACDPVTPQGIIVVNPPYGERLGDVESLKPLYVQLGDTFKRRFKGWTGYIFTGSPDLAKSVGLKASRRFVLFNGAIECRLLKYDLYEGRKGEPPAAQPS